MEALRVALRKAGMTQTELARRVGVSRQQVNAWVNERETVPRSKAALVASLLGMTAVPTTARSYSARPSETPASFLDWLLRLDLSAHLGASYGERTAALASHVGASASTVLDWVGGRARIPADRVEDLAAAWGRLPATLFFLAGEVGVFVPEDIAVVRVDLGAAETFEEALATLSAAADEWRRDPTLPLTFEDYPLAPVGEEWEFLAAKAREFYERRVVANG